MGFQSLAFLVLLALTAVLCPLAAKKDRRAGTALAMLVSIVCAVVTYLVAVVKTHAITLADLKLIPKGEKLAKVLHIR